ncbi:GDSL-type esterase/lipase family protein [Candidatus Omnitrophota bacterium]
MIANKILNKQITEQKIRQINILCVGDSFTQGVGSSGSDYSYPAQLQRYLSKKDNYDWQVLNCGVTGTNSSEIVNFLPRIFEHFLPNFLCVLVGINDSWNFNFTDQITSEPDLQVIEEKKEELIPWQLRFRTLRLIKMILKYFQDRKIVKEFLLKQKVENSPPNIGTSQNSIDSEIRLAYSLSAQKRIDQALNHAHKIKRKISDKPARHHLHLAWLFIHLREFRDAADEIKQYEKYFPDDLGEIDEITGNLLFEKFDYDMAQVYFKKVIAGYPEKTFSYRTLARIYSLQDDKLEQALTLLIQAYLIDEDGPQTKLYLSIVHSSAPFTLKRFTQTLDRLRQELKIDPNSYQQLYILAQTMIRRIATLTFLEKNLTKISALCGQNQVVPIFVTYPMYSPINQKIRDFCSDQNQLIIDGEDIFKELLKEERFEKYFVLDSHLNNEGYRILAEHIAQLLTTKASFYSEKRQIAN